MFNVDARVRAKISREISRVLIVDPNMATTRVLIDLLKDLGVRQRMHEVTTDRALAVAAEWDPHVILIEMNAPKLDAVEFTERLRRSDLAARKAPVIVVTADTRESSIKAARDAGAHEFLCKPFTAGHVFRRLENVALKPRPWIEAKMYVGPDRRRFNSGQFEGTRKRRADTSASTASTLAFTHFSGRIHEQIEQMESHPIAALQAMMAHTTALQTVAPAQSRPDLTAAITAFQRCLSDAIAQGGASPDILVGGLTAILACRDPSETVRAVPSPARLQADVSGLPA